MCASVMTLSMNFLGTYNLIGADCHDDKLGLDLAITQQDHLEPSRDGFVRAIVAISPRSQLS